MNKEIQISLVSTVYNSEDIIHHFIEKVELELRKISDKYEIILIEDCSRDSSWETIEKICKINTSVKGLKLSRNFGQQIAMSAGIKEAKGDYVIIMDGDLQNPPSAISKIFEELNKGFEIVYTTSNTRNNFRTKISSKLFWYVLTKLLKVNIVKNQLMMKGFTKKVTEQFNGYEEINRTISGVINDIGFNHSIVEVENKKRKTGKSNYNFLSRFNLMIDIVISMSSAPLNFMIYIGLTIFVFTLFSSSYFLYKYLFYNSVPGFTSLMLALSFFGSITIIMLGFIGRYLSNIYTEVRQRPMYIVERKCNF